MRDDQGSDIVFDVVVVIGGLTIEPKYRVGIAMMGLQNEQWINKL